MELQMELTRGEIPFRITSGIRFFEQAHIKDVVAFMRFVVNPRDELSFRRMVMLLPGIGPGMAQKLWVRWAACPESRQETPPESFSALMLDFPVPAKSKTAWTQLCYTLDELAPAGKIAGPASMLISINEAVYGVHAGRLLRITTSAGSTSCTWPDSPNALNPRRISSPSFPCWAIRMMKARRRTSPEAPSPCPPSTRPRGWNGPSSS